jgi:putative ABC transport system permease protein
MSVRRFFLRSRWDDERRRELEAYLAIEIDENVARGMTPEDARFAARRKLGNATLVREEIYNMNSLGFVETMWHDLRYGARLLRLNPGFAVVAVLSLALGIGANTAIFQLLDAVRLRTLPVSNAHELVNVRIVDLTGARGQFNTWRPAVSYPIWERIRDDREAFSGVLAWNTATFDLATTGVSRFTEGGLWVSGEFFTTLGVRPHLGRVFGPADDRRGCANPGAVISYAFWQRELAADPAVVGRTVSLDNHAIEIVGVTPPGFFGLEIGQSYDVALPLCAEPILNGENHRLDSGTTWWLTIMGRLKPGWSAERASAHLASISPGLFEATLPRNYPPESVTSYLAFKLGAFAGASGSSLLRERYSSPLWLLLAIAGMVLLIACANLANLMLARATVRGREIAVRLAIGASRGRVIRQLLAESVLLAAIGAALGALLARTMSRGLVAFLSTGVNPVFLALDLDWRVFAFTTAVAALTSILFGLAPAIRATRVPVGAVLKTGARGLTAEHERFAGRRALVVAQVALSLVLLVGALLFVGTFRNLLAMDAGFQQDGILQADLDMRRLNVPPGARLAVRRELLEAVRQIPGVEAAADVNIVPISGSNWTNAVWIDGADRDQRTAVSFNSVSDRFFDTLRIPMTAGRDFNGHDRPGAPLVAIVNEMFARKLTNGANPLGRRFRVEQTANSPETIFEVVGLVRDTKYADLRDDFKPIAFLAASQEDRPRQSQQIFLRSPIPMPDLMASVSRALSASRPGLAFHYHVFKTQIRETLLRERLMATLSAFFGILAVVLSTLGLYGVMSYMVAQRRNEIGIRMALGADRGSVVRMVMREVSTLLAAGLIVGTVLALAAARTGGTLLFGLRPWDLRTLAMALATLGGVALLAGYLPALRASRLEPREALREE